MTLVSSVPCETDRRGALFQNEGSETLHCKAPYNYLWRYRDRRANGERLEKQPSGTLSATLGDTGSRKIRIPAERRKLNLKTLGASRGAQVSFRRPAWRSKILQ
jgi:hypothetical protein